MTAIENNSSRKLEELVKGWDTETVENTAKDYEQRLADNRREGLLGRRWKIGAKIMRNELARRAK